MAERSELNELMRQARAEARLSASPQVESEHLLLALSSRTRSRAGKLLAEHGLDHDGVLDALDGEFARSLAVVGVTLAGFGLPERPLPLSSDPGIGHTAKLAFHHAIRSKAGRKDRKFDLLHVLLGILTADSGRVARALDAVDVDRGGLAEAARAALNRAA